MPNPSKAPNTYETLRIQVDFEPQKRVKLDFANASVFGRIRHSLLQVVADRRPTISAAAGTIVRHKMA